MNALEKVIKAKGEQRTNEKETRNELWIKESNEIRENIIKNYCPRVAKALDVMQMIKDNDPELWDKISPGNFPVFMQSYKNPNYFYTDGFYHTLGFYGAELNAIGCCAGGACGNINFVVTRNDCHFEMRGIEDGDDINFFSRERAKAFPRTFEEFEARFRKFVNEQYGEGAYDL